MHLLDLTRSQRRRLERQLKAAPNIRVYRRTLALVEIAEGRPVAEIAGMLRMSREAIYRWVGLYAESPHPAVLIDRYRGGRPTFWSDELQAVLQQALEHSPDEWEYKAVNWTVPLLREHIERVSGRKPSDATVRRQLHRLDYVWKRSRHVLPDSKSARATRRKRLIRQKVKNLPPGCAKLFEDETDILLFPPLRAGWALRGQEAEVPISGENAQRTIFGTIDIETGHRLLVAREHQCAIDFQVILRMIRQDYGDRKVALLLDGDSSHTANESKALAAQLDIELIWLPARCPQLNPMDRLWNCGKQKVCANRQYKSIDDQAKRFIDYLLGLSAHEALRKAGILSGNFWLFR
jgi:transposase